MSFLAAVLLLNMDPPDAFICFANLLNKPCQMAFFRVDHPMVGDGLILPIHYQENILIVQEELMGDKVMTCQFLHTVLLLSVLKLEGED